jgi:hypothetical protein
MSFHRAIFLVVAALGASLPAFGGTVLFTCDPSVDTGTCTTLNGAIAALYSSTFTNANANIYIQMAGTGLGSSMQYYDTVTYAAYYAALQGDESDANDVTAVNSLGSSSVNPVAPGDGIALPSALAAALSLPGGTGITTGNFTCTLTDPGCYNGVITLGATAGELYYRSGAQDPGSYDIYSVVEHEVDEILGTSSCIAATGSPAAPVLSADCVNNGNGSAAPDLFRYSDSLGDRSYINQGNGTTAYFSINGGVTDIADYNNSPNGADYGDWDSSALRVQDAYGTPGISGMDITNDGGSEIAVLDAIGYTLNTQGAVPEPGTMILFGTALGLVSGRAYWLRKRRS